MHLALFDFDGTLTQGDSYLPFIYDVTCRVRIGIFAAALWPWTVAYKLGRYPATKMRALVSRAAFIGRSQAAVDAAGLRYAGTLRQTLRPDMLERLERHLADGHQVLVVSASLGPYLRPFCAELGVDVICTELEAVAGILTGGYVQGDCSAEEKARRVRARYDLTRYTTISAYGDTAEDYPLLRLAQHRVYQGQEMPATFPDD